MKYQGIEYTQHELATMAGVSRMYLSRNANRIKALDLLPNKSDINYLSNRSLSVYLSYSNTMREALGAVCGWLLRYEYKLTTHERKARNIVAVGDDVLEVMRVILSRKRKEANIYSQTGAGRRLMRSTKIAFIDELFTRRKVYYKNNPRIMWSLTPLANDILHKAIETLIGKIHYSTTLNLPYFVSIGVGGYVTLDGLLSYKYATKCNTINNINHTIKLHHITNSQTKHFTINTTTLQTFEHNSILHVLSACIGTHRGKLVISANHTSHTNQNLGRSYNVFTRIRSRERLALGYIAYDISAALQVISLQLIGAKESEYPLLWEYAYKPTKKRAFRQTIALDTGLPIDKVKQDLTAYANGKTSGTKRHKLLMAFQVESDKLRRAVLRSVEISEPSVLAIAIKQSRRVLPEDINWLDTSVDKGEAQNKSSVFFFVWTCYERRIRQSMMSLLTDGIEVHDAVYSKQDIKTSEIVKHIKQATNFDIRLTKEKK